MTRRALVLGGGVAGIAACFELCDAGYEVELYESRRELGGRVFSFHDAASGCELDNGPHVMLGCYSRMRRLLRRVGTEGAFVQPRSLSLVFREAGGRRSELALSRWPTPLAMPLALMRLRGLSWSQRLRGLRGMVSSLRGARAGVSLAEWLARRGQLDGPDRFLWLPLCLAVMNSRPEETSAATFLATLRRAFSGRARNAAIWIPRRPWSDIVGRPARERLESEGVDVRVSHRITTLHIAGGRVDGVEFGDGSRREVGADEVVVSALPWHRLARAAPVAAGDAAAFEARPIVNVYFEFEEPGPLPDDGALVGLVGGAPFQFVYRRPGDRAGRFAMIGGAPIELDGESTDEIARRARQQLAVFYPDAVLHDSAQMRVTKEAHATLRVGPDVAARRPAPGPVPGVANLTLCGDWTETGLPSTLEGAAESAARAVAETLVRGRVD